MRISDWSSDVCSSDLHANDRMSAQGWIDAMIVHGAIRADAILFVHAQRAACDGDAARFAEVAELAAATLISRERRIEATAQGAAFHRFASSTEAAPALAMLDIIADEALSYPVSVACLPARAQMR